MKPRNLNQNRLSMVVVGTLSPVEMRLWKKRKRRWAAEPGVWAILFILFPPSLFRDGSMPGRCLGFIACCPSQGLPDELNIPSGQDACCAVVLTLCGLDRSSCGALSPVGVGQRQVLGGFLLGSSTGSSLNF